MPKNADVHISNEYVFSLVRALLLDTKNAEECGVSPVPVLVHNCNSNILTKVYPHNSKEYGFSIARWRFSSSQGRNCETDPQNCIVKQLLSLVKSMYLPFFHFQLWKILIHKFYIIFSIVHFLLWNQNIMYITSVFS